MVMKKKFYSFMLFIFTALFLFSCQKEKTTSNEDVAKVHDAPLVEALQCGLEQESREGLCFCGTTGLVPEDAQNWECVDAQFRCYRESCAAKGINYPLRSYFKDGAVHCSAWTAPKEVQEYECSPDGWICKNESCSCGGAPIRKDAICFNDGIRCIEDECQCGGQSIVRGMICSNGEGFCGKSKLLADYRNYRCTLERWKCDNEESCLCGSAKIAQDVECFNEELSCDEAVVPKDFIGYSCSNDAWECLLEEGCLCGEKRIDKGFGCRDGEEQKPQSYAEKIQKDEKCTGDFCSQVLENAGYQYLSGTTDGSCREEYEAYICAKPDGCINDEGLWIPFLTQIKIENNLFLSEYDYLLILYKAYPALWGCDMSSVLGSLLDKEMHYLASYYCSPYNQHLICNDTLCFSSGRHCLRGESWIEGECVCEQTQGCASEDTLQCGNSKLSTPGEICKDGKIYCQSNDKDPVLAPVKPEGYSCTRANNGQSEWRCKNEESCLCGGKLCPTGASCRNEVCLCDGHEMGQTNTEEYVCKKWGELSFAHWTCDRKEGCACGTERCPYGASCIDNVCSCSGVTMPGADYSCTMKAIYGRGDAKPFWYCENENACSCGNESCPKNAKCMDGICYCGSEPMPAGSGEYRCENGRKAYRDEKDRWVCTQEEGCACHAERCLANMYCTKEGCSCGDEEKLKDTGYTCQDKQWRCSQEEGCICNNIPVNMNARCTESSYLSYTCKSDELEGYSDQVQSCGLVQCPAGTLCRRGQCVFLATPQEKIDDPVDYVSHWGFARCNNEKGCRCANTKCSKDQYCREGQCHLLPTYLRINNKPMYLTLLSAYTKYYEFLNIFGSTVTNFSMPEDLWDNNNIIFEFLSRSTESTTKTKHICANMEAPIAENAYACLIEISMEYDDCEVKSSFSTREIGWVCALKEGCACGKNTCQINESCTENDKCIQISTDVQKDNNDKEEHDDSSSIVCDLKEGCPCGAGTCPLYSACVNNETCDYKIDSYTNAACASPRVFGLDANDRGQCVYKELAVAPYYYEFVDDFGFRCTKDSCPCASASCAKSAFCIKEGRCSL